MADAWNVSPVLSQVRFWFIPRLMYGLFANSPPPQDYWRPSDISNFCRYNNFQDLEALSLVEMQTTMMCIFQLNCQNMGVI